MDIMELGAIGELVGGIAVIATLVYLALQVRQGTQVARAQVQQESSRMSTELFLSADREILDLFTQAAKDPKGLSESDLGFLRAQLLSQKLWTEATVFHVAELPEHPPASPRYRLHCLSVFAIPSQDIGATAAGCPQASEGAGAPTPVRGRRSRRACQGACPLQMGLCP